MRLHWSRQAVVDLEALRQFVERDNPGAARGLALRIVALVDTLDEHRGLGRPGRVPGTRELVVSGTPYLVAYEIHDDAIVVLRVLHGARRWPARL